MIAAIELGASTTTWFGGIGTFLTGVAALTAIGLVGWGERRKLLTQSRHDERRKLRELIDRFHGRLLEAAIDWDRRMHQLYDSNLAPEDWPNARKGMTEVAYFLSDPDHHGQPATYIHGKLLDQEQYLFRSYVLRFLALCGFARRFEREAFYINAQAARPSDFQFLKYTKAFIWAMRNSDLHDDVVPSKDHFPNDEFRPILEVLPASVWSG